MISEKEVLNALDYAYDDMNEQYKKILLKYDEVGSYETPKQFDYKKLRNKIVELKNNLDKKFTDSFIIDDQVQDASFRSDIKIPVKLIINRKKNYNYAVRISNFGNLSTFTFDNNTVITVGDAIINELRELGFIYIPNEELDVEYDGRFEGFKKILRPGEKLSWWIRYFDYL